MKTAIFTAALMFCGTAFAQHTNPAAGADPAVAGTQTSAPGNAAPERDARGIPVGVGRGRGAGRRERGHAGGAGRGVHPEPQPAKRVRDSAVDRDLSGLLADRHRQLRADLRAGRRPAALSAPSGDR